MDGISSATAVIGLVQAAAQAATALGRYASRIKGAESSRAKLLDQIRLISAAETAIASIVQNSPRSAHTPELQALIDDWFTDSGPPTKCKRELEELSRWLEKDAENNSKHKRWAKKITWPMKEDKIQAAIRAFEGYMPYFRDVLSIETYDLVKGMATRFKNTEVAAAKSELLLWLDGFDCTNKHDSTLHERQQATGDWLFREKLYVDWRKGSTGFIWLHGKAGAGKSVLVSAVINDLSNGLADNEALAYFYCDFRNIRCTHAMEILRSVTKQLLWESKKDWLSSFSDLISRKARDSGPPTDLGTLLDLLKRAAELHERPVIVIDAMDECEDLPKLLNELGKLGRGHCRLFVTSRTMHTIRTAFTGLPSITLDDRVDEMRSDTHSYIKTELQSRSRLKVLAQDVKDEIEGVLMKKADGMFRWVQCQLDRLDDCYSLGDVREVLDTLPATLYETYDQMLLAIDKKPTCRDRARRALRWLVTALVPLSLSQLADAMSISCDEPVRDSVNAPMHKTVILDILGSLVTVDRDNVILSHYSVKEYLTSDTIANGAYFIDGPSASLELVTVSLFSLILFSDESETALERGEAPLYWYADCYGLRHLVNCHSDHNASLVKHLLTFQNHVSVHRLIYERSRWRNEWMPITPQLALYIVIRFGHPDLLRCYLNSHPVQATEEDNPLVFAALYSNIPHVQLLLDNGLDVNHPGPVHAVGVRKMTPLTAAARNRTCDNQEGLVRLLLQNGCVVSRDAIYSLLSCDLSTGCKPAVVRILLEHGADPQWLAAGRRSCLHPALLAWVPSCDALEIFQMLVAAGCDPMALDDLGRSPFHFAIRFLSIELVGWLLRRGFQPPSDAILWATSFFTIHDTPKLLSVLELLLENGASAGVQGDDGCNALHHIFCQMHEFDGGSMESLVQLLVEHGCDINGCNNAGETPLHLAGPGLSLDVLDLFLAQGAQLPKDIVNYAIQPRRYLPDTVQRERVIATLSFLVDKLGASCRLRTSGGDNALHCLLKSSVRPEPEYVLDVVLFLMKNGCDVVAPGPFGETPLQLAIENNFCPIVLSILGLIIEPCPNDYIKQYHGDSEGNGILHRLCYMQDDQLKDKVELLRDAGYNFARDINRPNNKGFTPLCIALMHGRATYDPAIISCLIDLGASFSHVNYLHLESLGWASNLPWYHDAANAHGRCLSQSKITFDDVILVDHLLRVAHQGRLSTAVTRSILDMAEYWACIKVTRKNIWYRNVAYSDEIAFPMVPENTGCWIPSRLVFACKAGVFVPRTQNSSAEIRVHIRWTGYDAVFTVPIYLRVGFNDLDLPRVCLDVWDKFTPAVYENGRDHLMVEELIPGDILSVQFANSNNDYFTLEFFQVEAYYMLMP